jgi:hypothetical protein
MARKSLTSLAERQAMMRDRVKQRPCEDGRSRKARRVRARLIKLEDVVPRTHDYVVKRRAARFMLGRNFSHAYVANQLGMSVPDLEAMIREDQPEREPGDGARNLLQEQEREKRREAKDPLAKLWKPENEVTFVTASGPTGDE